MSATMDVTAMAQAYAAMAANLSAYAVQVTGGDSKALTLINNKLDVLISSQAAPKNTGTRLVQSGTGASTSQPLPLLRMPSQGMYAPTGRLATGLEHLQQSIADILLTRIGSRVMRRTYGSRLFELLDKPLNPNTVLQWTAAVADALERWEPRFKLQQVKPSIRSKAEGLQGKWWLELQGTYLGAEIKLGVGL